MSDTVHNRIVITLTILTLIFSCVYAITGLVIYLVDAIEFFLLASIFDLVKLYRVRRGKHEKK